MKINTQSIIYKYLTEGLFDSPKWVPTNLCPYMRWFVWNVMREFVGVLLVAIIIQGMILLPIKYLFDLDLGQEYLAACMATGFFAWSVIGILFLFVGTILLFDNDYAARQALDRVANKMALAVSRNIFMQWYKSIHDQICPSIEFYHKDKQ